MPVIVRDDEQLPYVLVYEFSGNWTDSEFRSAIDEAAERSRLVPGDLRQDGIALFLSSTRSLLGVNPFDLMGFIRQKLPERGGCMVAVSTLQMVDSMLEILNALVDRKTQRIFHRSSLEEARALIAELRAGKGG